MSIKIMTDVWQHATVDGGTLLVLLALADSADEASRTCYPGIASIAAKARLSERQTQYCIQKLRDEGVVSVDRNASPLKTNLYKIAQVEVWRSARDANTAPPPEKPDTQFLHPRDAAHCVSETQPIAPKPSVTVSIEPSESLYAREAAFSRFWDAYPKRVGRPAAKKNFDRAVKAGADPEDIIAGARAYARTDAVARGFAKHPQGWLTDERWNDEPEMKNVNTTRDDYGNGRNGQGQSGNLRIIAAAAIGAFGQTGFEGEGDSRPVLGIGRNA